MDEDDVIYEVEAQKTMDFNLLNEVLIIQRSVLWEWILNEIVSLQQKSSLWNTQGAFCIFLFFCAISIDDRLNLFHQSIIVILIINSAEHRITYNITISID